MKQPIHIELTSDLIDEITAQFPSRNYKASSTLYYEGQIPISGFLILNGTIQISNKRKLKKILTIGTLVGVSELMKKKPSPIRAEVFPNTKICFLDKSTIQELCKYNDKPLSIFLSNLLKEPA